MKTSTGKVAASVCGAVLLGVGAGLAFAAGATLDPNYGEGGIAWVEAGTGRFLADTVHQADGRLVMVGARDTGRVDASGSAIQEWVLRRLSPAGAIDASFGAGGTVALFGAYGGNPADVAVDAQDRLWVAGWSRVLTTVTKGKGKSTITTHATLARLLPDGALDPSFGSGGVVRIPLSGYVSPRAASLVLQPDGMVVVAGLAGWVVPGTGGGKTYTYPWVARCSASGLLDASFGKDGATVDTRRPYVLSMGGVARQSGGRILLTHSVGDGPTGPFDYVVTGYTSAGKIDASFGPVAWPTESSVGIAVDPSDRVLVTTNTGGSNPSMVRVRRYLSAGVLDPSFGSAGVASFGVYVNQRAYTNPVLDAEGRILFGIAGAGTFPGATFQAAAVRLLDDGSPDPSFGGNGLGQPVDLGPGASAWGHTLDVAPDGSALLTGVGSTSATAWFAVRYAPE